MNAIIFTSKGGCKNIPVKLLVMICAAQFFWGDAIAQLTISGKVVEANTAKPVGSASVFLSNSSVATATDSIGNFVLKHVPPNKCTLVVSCIGYETFVKDLPAGNTNPVITVKLNRKTADLAAVVVTPEDKNGWINWGDLFIENFIGTSSYAGSCKIKNPAVLKFRRNYKDSTLTASAGEPLIIENKSLGYVIRYDLKEFTYYFSGNAVRWSGYALFEEMVTDDKAKLKYRENRMQVYGPSLMHFIRSLYKGTAAQEGYQIIRLVNNNPVDITNNPEQTDQQYSGVAKYDTIYEISNTETTIKIIPVVEDSVHAAGTADLAVMGAIVFHQGENAFLHFSDTLQVIYTKNKVPFEYLKRAANRSNTMVSEMSLQQAPVTIMANGSYSPAALVLNGFWGWWEKIAIMLPYDYEVNGNQLLKQSTH